MPEHSHESAQQTTGQNARDRGDLRLLETVVDDTSPEHLGGVHETLADQGATHVSVVPMTTKGARPGHLIRVTVAAEHADGVAKHLAKATGSLGVRELRATHRFIADTTHETVTIEVDGSRYDIDVKLGWMDETVYSVKAEYDATQRVAVQTDLSISEIARRAEAAVDH